MDFQTYKSTTAFEVRQRVGAVLRKYGLSNKFSVRLVGFSDLARGSAYVVKIKNWQPNPVARNIKEQLSDIAIMDFGGSG